ncbi:MAG: hypothetical protein HRT40_03825 [Campylobacteraceae bacterium]|nr:hypothetical protein [Campylobacteraceae bacterium]
MIKLNAKNSLIIALSFMAGVLILYFPKIYIKNNIYYTSKDINKLYNHYTSLREENRFLVQQLEDMKFKNQIIDSLIINTLDKQ